MMSKRKTLLLSLLALLSLFVSSQTSSQTAKTKTPAQGPEYTSNAELKRPELYREWIYLTTGFDMSYNPGSQMPDHHMFDSVFVNPEAYKAFLETGTWPDKTMLVLEARGAEGKGSINQRGNYQSTDVMGFEVHVKDETRFPGKWAFFTFGDSKTGKLIPASAECYSCHAQHAAVDTTFVQFYPTLLPIAKSKNTLAAPYQEESAKTAQKNPGD
jgi:Cytochrome P460